MSVLRSLVSGRATIPDEGLPNISRVTSDQQKSIKRRIASAFTIEMDTTRNFRMYWEASQKDSVPRGVENTTNSTMKRRL